ncbi:MAG TPA: BON domain-containing protein [Stellaceae bacterium]
MRSDSEIEQDVEKELQVDTSIDLTDVAVAVERGVVTLSGFVRTFSEKLDADRAAKRVLGVVGVANDLDVRLRDLDDRPDPLIARVALAAIRDRLPGAADRIRAVAKNGWVTLEGEVGWDFERQAAVDVVAALESVKGVSDMIQLEPRAAPEEIKRRIAAALGDGAADADDITVEVDGDTVILEGSVDTPADRDAAERAARSAPGVMAVDNQLAVAS